MKDNTTRIVFIGGDMRTVYAAEALSHSYVCEICGFDGSYRNIPVFSGSGGMADIGVLPITQGGRDISCPFRGKLPPLDISILPRIVRSGGIVFSGRLFPELDTLCAENGFELHSYLDREELAVANARLTAEGALAAAINETDYSLHGAKVLILGFGRIAKLTARYFSAVGAVVTAAARKMSDLAWISALGYGAVSFADGDGFGAALRAADIIINTVPAGILSGQNGAAIRESTLLIELASIPCTDEAPAFRVIKANGLPGRTAPMTAGHIIAQTIQNILTERSIKNGRT